jgi:hypothetical protein
MLLFPLPRPFKAFVINLLYPVVEVHIGITPPCTALTDISFLDKYERNRDAVGPGSPGHGPVRGPRIV